MLIFGSVNAFAQEQEEQKVQTPEEMAAKEADRLGELLKLEYYGASGRNEQTPVSPRREL